MGEARKRAETCGADTFIRVARGFIVQKGSAFVERAFLENPELLQNQYFTNVINSWMGDLSSQGFLVFIQRRDGRDIAFTAAEHGTLVHGVLPQIFNEFHARMQCCPFSAYVAPEFEAVLKSILDHRHDQTFKDPGAPAVKRLEHPDYGTMIFIDVPKKLVERAQVSGVLRTMDAMVATSDGIKKNAQRVMLAFSGYEENPGEVFELPEVKTYMRKIVSNAPWWPALAHPDTFMMWFSGILDYTDIDKGSGGTFKVRCDPDTLKKSIDESLPMVSLLLNSADVAEEDIETMLGRVVDALTAFAGGKAPEIMTGMAPAADSGQSLH